MKKILIATDGSPASRDAVQLGLELVVEDDAEAIFVHVAPGYDVLPVHAYGVKSAMPHRLTDHDRAPLVEALKVASDYGVSAETQLLVGNPADEIVAFCGAAAEAAGAAVNAAIAAKTSAITRTSVAPILLSVVLIEPPCLSRLSDC